MGIQAIFEENHCLFNHNIRLKPGSIGMFEKTTLNQPPYRRPPLYGSCEEILNQNSVKKDILASYI